MWGGMWGECVPKKSGPHVEKKLAAVAVGSKPPGRHADGGGLYLEVEASGARRWLLRTVIHGRRRDIGLGSTKLVSLAEAREMAARCRKLARSGKDPLVELRKGTAPDFEEAAKACHEARRGSWRNGKHQDQWISSLKAYAFPILGRIRVDLIETSHVIDVLQPIWVEKPETARRVRQRIGLVLDWAKAKGFRTNASPTREIGRALPAHKDRQKHHAALPYSDVPGFLQNLRASGASNATKGALEFLILTASRTNETLQLTWSEVDMEHALWSVPASRMKSGRPHTVPLSDRALEILKAAKLEHSGKGEFVFEARSGKSLSNMSLLMAMRRMDVPAVPHGFRSSFRTWAAETTNHPREVAEACLAHVTPDKVERAYQRSDFLQRRKAMMEAWARWCCNDVAEVVELRSRKSNA